MSDRPTLPSTRSAVSGRMVALEERVVSLETRVVSLETRVHELQHWIVVIIGVFLAMTLLALTYAVRSVFV